MVTLVVFHHVANYDVWKTVFDETGIQFMPLNTIYQLATETPERLARAAQMLTIAVPQMAIVNSSARNRSGDRTCTKTRKYNIMAFASVIQSLRKAYTFAVLANERPAAMNIATMQNDIGFASRLRCRRAKVPSTRSVSRK